MGELAVRLRAPRAREPGAVVVRRAAARLGFWPELRVGELVCAFPTERESRPGIRFERRRIPAELVTTLPGGLLVTSPALTALDLCDDGPDVIDQVLRRRAARLIDLRDALRSTSGRRGNRNRLALLIDSRDEPWSAAERLCHRLLRAHRISGWTANHPVRLGDRRYFLDVAFPREKLVVEIDGRFHDDDPDTFESDRRRQNALVLAGWTVLRFTWRMLQDDPAFVIAQIEAALISSRSMS